MTALRFIPILFLISFLVFTRDAFSFPEMIRHGYVNCSSCHLSVNGGGILNDYGRAIVREELALFKSDDEKSTEHLFLYGALEKAPVHEWLKGGGDIRSVYLYQNDAKKKQGRTIFMQADLELAAVTGKWTVDASAGAQQIPGKNVEFVGRKHWVSYAVTDNWNVRGGKFIPSFGILTADHTSLTKDPLRIGYGFETYNLEVSYISEKFNFFATGVFGKPTEDRTHLDDGFTWQGSFAPTEKLKFGLNTFYGRNDTYERLIYGIFGMVGLTDQLFLSSEIDYQTYLKGVKGIATTQKISYQITEGLWAFGIQEYGKSNFNSERTLSTVYGAGMQIFPRSHFDFSLTYENVTRRSYQTDAYDYVFFLSHYYL